MQDKLSDALTFLRELGPVKLLLAAIVVILFFILSIAYLYRVSSYDMAMLYSDLDLDDSGKIVAALEARNIPYEAVNGGSIIKVPGSQVTTLRLSLAQEGIPGRGSLVGYEIFDNEETLGTTNFLQNVKMVRALEGEISRTIASFDTVKKARVHLVIPQREIFSRDKQDPRASVVLKLSRSTTLSKSEIGAISHLVLTAVPGLEMKNISIVDTNGRSLKLGGEEDANSGINNAEDYRIAYERRLKTTIEELLERSFGVGKVIAQISVEMNFDRIVTNAEIYDPDGAVIRSVQSSEEHEKTPVGGEENSDMSMANNLPGGSGGSAGAGGGSAATVDRSDETKNYEISKTIKSHITEAGVINKLSIAVLVDGDYIKKPGAKEGTFDLEYKPRTAEELAQIEQIVRAASGFKEERKDQIKVSNIRFAAEEEKDEETTQDWLKDELPSLFQTLVLAVVVVLVFITVVRPIAIRAFETKSAIEQVQSSIASSPQSSAAIPAMEAHPDGTSNAPESTPASLLGERGSKITSMRKVNEVMAAHPDEAVMVLRKWLSAN